MDDYGHNYDNAPAYGNDTDSDVDERIPESDYFNRASVTASDREANVARGELTGTYDSEYANAINEKLDSDEEEEWPRTDVAYGPEGSVREGDSGSPSLNAVKTHRESEKWTSYDFEDSDSDFEYHDNAPIHGTDIDSDDEGIPESNNFDCASVTASDTEVNAARKERAGTYNSEYPNEVDEDLDSDDSEVDWPRTDDVVGLGDSDSESDLELEVNVPAARWDGPDDRREASEDDDSDRESIASSTRSDRADASVGWNKQEQEYRDPGEWSDSDDSDCKIAESADVDSSDDEYLYTNRSDTHRDEDHREWQAGSGQATQVYNGGSYSVAITNTIPTYSSSGITW